jgi:hypothetical protein
MMLIRLLSFAQSWITKAPAPQMSLQFALFLELCCSILELAR